MRAATWAPACRESDVAPGTALAVCLPGRAPGSETLPVTIVRDEAGGWHGIGGYCSHGPVPLGEGDVIGRAVECWGHGSRFDLATGAPRNLPATLPVPVYRVRLENGAVLIDTSPTGEGE